MVGHNSSAIFNHKIIEGFVWAPLKATVNQLNVSLLINFNSKKDGQQN